MARHAVDRSLLLALGRWQAWLAGPRQACHLRKAKLCCALKRAAAAALDEALQRWGRVVVPSSLSAEGAALLRAGRPGAAQRLFRRAAVLGHLPSLTSVGLCLAEGLGSARDDRQAVAWLEAAAAGGELFTRLRHARRRASTGGKGGRACLVSDAERTPVSSANERKKEERQHYAY